MTAPARPRSSRDLRVLSSAMGLSAFGDELAITALLIKVAEVHGGVSLGGVGEGEGGPAVAALLVAGVLPQVVLAPFAGWLVDRTESSRALRFASVVQASLATALAFADGFLAILFLVFLLGAAASVAGPATFTLVPAVTTGDITRANAAVEASRYAGWVLGPIAAGTLVIMASTQTALLVDAGTFVGVAIAMVVLRARRPPVAGAPRERPMAEAMAGLRAVARDRVLVVAFVVVGLVVVFAAMDNVAEVFFAYDVLGDGAFGLGVLATGWLGGMVIGAAFVAPRIKPGRHASAIALAGVGGGVAIALAALTTQLAPAAVLFGLGGVSNGVVNVSLRTLIHLRAPEALRGRVFAASSGLSTGAQLGATAMAGPVVAAAGARTALLIGGIGSIVVGLGGLTWLAAGERAEERRTSSDP
ncbi:MAG: MFS transporter [Actinomycetota bacterium]